MTAGAGGVVVRSRRPRHPAPGDRLVRVLLALASVLSAAAAAQVPAAEVTVYDAEWATEGMESGEVFAGCSLGCALGWEIVASSSLPAQGGNRYDVSQLDDASARTAWVEGADGSGVGEALTFRLVGDPDHDVGAVAFSGFRVVNGYAKSEDVWRKNGRVRAVVVLVNGRSVGRAELADTMSLQWVALADAPQVVAGDVVTLVLASVYPGERYDDTALSEVVLDGAH